MDRPWGQDKEAQQREWHGLYAEGLKKRMSTFPGARMDASCQPRARPEDVSIRRSHCEHIIKARCKPPLSLGAILGTKGKVKWIE